MPSPSARPIRLVSTANGVTTRSFKMQVLTLTSLFQGYSISSQEFCKSMRNLRYSAVQKCPENEEVNLLCTHASVFTRQKHCGFDHRRCRNIRSDAACWLSHLRRLPLLSPKWESFHTPEEVAQRRNPRLDTRHGGIRSKISHRL